jgi:GT2 family glycosyltransferase
MQPSVTAVLVVRNGSRHLPRTLAALAAQTRRPDSVVLVDAGSTDDSAGLLRDAGLGPVTATPGRRSFGSAVAHGVSTLAPAAGKDDWLWILGHDNAPAPTALSALLGAVEVAPSVAVAGPKLMRWDDGAVIASFGESVTRFGRSVPLVADELDQAQHDIQSDLLGVAAGGMLVRRNVWDALAGFDPGLPSVDAALDLCVRARLAGHRVIGVPSARVASAGPAELFGRRSLAAGSQNRIRRAAALHRRLAWAPALAVPLHWLALVPLAIARSVAHLVGKRPGWVGGELAAGFRAAFDGTVPRARRLLRRNRQVGWGAIAPLRMPWSALRERRVAEREGAAPPPAPSVGFFLGGGAWIVLLAAVGGVVAFGRFVGSPALAGGGLLPLSGTLGELWSNVGYGWHDVGAGFTGPSDPFAVVLALLGTVTFWAPSWSIVLLYLLALPLAALTAWWCAARFADRGLGPAVAALGWAAAPPFLVALGEGRLGAVLAHILLPALVAAVVAAARSWSSSAVAGLLFAAVAASAPSLVPALLIGLIAWIAARPAAIMRLIGIPLLAAVLFAPIVFAQIERGTPLALFADPGVPLGSAAASGWQLAVGGGLAGWDGLLAALGAPAAAAPFVVLALFAPLAVLAVLAPFLRGTGRAIPALAIALVGFVTAVAASHLQVAVVGDATVAVWAGAGLSLYWLGLLGAFVVTVDALRSAAIAPALVAALALLALAVPTLADAAGGATPVAGSTGRILPAYAAAEAATRPDLGTLELDPRDDGAVAIALHRGQGTTLDEQSTLEATDTTVGEADRRLATLAGNLASRSGFDAAAELDDLRIAFVLLTATDEPGAQPAQQRVTEALDGNRILTPIGTTASGTLWYYAGLADGDAPSGPGPLGTPLGIGILAVQAAVLLLTLLLAIPTTRRRRLRTATVTGREPGLAEGEATA